MKKEIPVIEFQIEKVDVNPNSHKLKGKWTVELDPEIESYYYCEPTRWVKFCHWANYLFVKGKVEKL